jgi:spore coat protein H
MRLGPGATSVACLIACGLGAACQPANIGLPNRRPVAPGAGAGPAPTAPDALVPPAPPPVADASVAVAPDAGAIAGPDGGAVAGPDGGGPGDGSAVAPDGPPGDGGAGVAAVFDLEVLHRIEIQVASEHLTQLDKDQVNRVPCTIVFDGVTLPGSGIRKKGGNGSLRPLADKPAFSIKFNEFVKGQKLHGLSKLLLNNAVQDWSFLNEHIVYELARREGVAAPLTAHGLVTFNGKPYGLYVVREAINDDFLRRVFGAGNDKGNLYEGGFGVDFVNSPQEMELKDEVEEARSRADLQEVARLARETPDARWFAVMSGKLDLPGFMTAMALEWHVGQWDGGFFQPNNYYIYNHPGRKVFVYIMVGMDLVLDSNLDDWDSRSFVARKVLALPETVRPYQAALARVLANLNVADVNARIDAAARTIRSHTPTDARTRADYRNFEDNLAGRKRSIATLKRDGRLPD